jgi:hypothetical protein
MSKDIRISGHARGRLRQRGIPEETVQAAVLYGKPRKNGRGGLQHHFNQGCARKAREAGHDFPELSETLVVVTKHNKVITAMWHCGNPTRVKNCRI